MLLFLNNPRTYRSSEAFVLIPSIYRHLSTPSLPVTHRVYTPEQEEDGEPVAKMVVYEAVR